MHMHSLPLEGKLCEGRVLGLVFYLFSLLCLSHFLFLPFCGLLEYFLEFFWSYLVRFSAYLFDR